jgi:hypothetical protein
MGKAGQFLPQGTNTLFLEVIAMKSLSALSLFLLASLTGPILAETPVKATSADACPLVGPLAETTADCAALRSAYRSEVSDCMDKMRADADARSGRRTDVNSHTSRSRFLICDNGVREKLALRSN